MILRLVQAAEADYEYGYDYDEPEQRELTFSRPRQDPDLIPFNIDRSKKFLPVLPGKYNALLDELNRVERLTDWGNVNFVIQAKKELDWAWGKLDDLIEAKTSLSIANKDVAYYEAKYSAFKDREAVRRDINNAEAESEATTKRGEGNKFESKSGLSSKDNMKVAWLMSMAGFELDQIAGLLGLAKSTTDKYIKTASKTVKVYNEVFDQEQGHYNTIERDASSLLIRF